jgi:uroporphyrinogen-III decarboxylase
MSLNYTIDMSGNTITGEKEAVMGNIVPSLDYHTEMSGEKVLKENLQKLHHSLNEDNIFALAYLILHPITCEEERTRLQERLHNKIQEMRDRKVPILDLINKVEQDNIGGEPRFPSDPSSDLNQ